MKILISVALMCIFNMYFWFLVRKWVRNPTNPNGIFCVILCVAHLNCQLRALFTWAGVWCGLLCKACIYFVIEEKKKNVLDFASHLESRFVITTTHRVQYVSVSSSIFNIFKFLNENVAVNFKLIWMDSNKMQTSLQIRIFSEDF